MATLQSISPDQSVRQVAGASTACAEILQRLPGARRRNRWTLQQLVPFARQNEINEGALLEELATAAGVPVRARVRPSRESRSLLPLIFTAMLLGIGLGTLFGVGLLLRIASAGSYNAVSGPSVHVHGLAQLWGWMTLFIFAVGGHLLRQNTTRPAPPWLEWSAAGFIISGLLTFLAGLISPVQKMFPAIDIAASGMLLVAAILLGTSIAWSLRGSVKSQRRHGLMALIGWLVGWAAVDLWLRVEYADRPILPDSARALLIVLPILGLATNAIYGFGLRLIPGLLNIGQLRQRSFAPALILHNVGLCLFLVPQAVCRMIGAIFMLAGAVFYVIGMDALRSKPSRPIYGIDARGHILIRVGFFWLIAGLAMLVVQQFNPNLPHAYSGAWRHALTVGFVTTMILGVGYRILPIFIKQPLASTRLMLLSVVLIIVGNAARVVLELLTIGEWQWSYRLMGISGVLELTALILFAVNIAATAQNARRVYSAAEPLAAHTRVQQAINARPELQDRLHELGVNMFDNAPFIAPSMTVGALALASGFQPDQLIALLESRPSPASSISCAAEASVQTAEREVGVMCL